MTETCLGCLLVLALDNREGLVSVIEIGSKKELV